MTLTSLLDDFQGHREGVPGGSGTPLVKFRLLSLLQDPSTPFSTVCVAGQNDE